MGLATADDVKARLGRDLSAQEQTAATFLVDGASEVIAAAAERTVEQIEALDPQPPVLKFVAVELVLRAMTNPGGLEAIEKTLGQYSSSQRFRTPPKGGSDLLELSKTEELMVRRAVHGHTQGSVPVESVVDEIYDSLHGIPS